MKDFNLDYELVWYKIPFIELLLMFESYNANVQQVTDTLQQKEKKPLSNEPLMPILQKLRQRTEQRNKLKNNKLS